MKKFLALVLLIVLALVGEFLWRTTSEAEIAPVELASGERLENSKSAIAAQQELAPATESQRVNEAPPRAEKPAQTTLIIHYVDQRTAEPVFGVDVEVKPQVDGSQAGATLPKVSPIPVMLKPGAREEVDGFNVPPGVLLEVWARSRTGKFPEVFQVVEPLERGARHEITLELALDSKLPMHVRIVDRETGIGIARARIERSFQEKPDLESDGVGRAFLMITKPDQGRAVSTARNGPLPTGFCRVRADGYGVAEFRESEGHERADIALEVRLMKSAALEVSIANRPDPRAEAYFLLATVGVATLEQNASTTTLEYDYGELKFRSACDLDGHVRLDSLPPNVSIDLLLSHGSEPLRKERVQLSPGEARALTIDLGAPCHLRGRVVDSAGQGVGDLEVWLKPLDTRISLRDGSDCLAKVRSDASGNFDMGQVAVGRFRVLLAPITYTYEDKQNSRGIASTNLFVEIAAGESEKDVELRVARGLYIRGKVVRVDGSAPSSNVSISAISAERTGASAKSLFDGSFILGPLMEGSYTLAVEENDFCGGSAPVEAIAGATGVVLVVLDGVSFSGRVVEYAGGPGVRAMLLRTYVDGRGITATQNTMQDGSFRYTMLRPTRMCLTAYTADGRIGVIPALSLSPGENRTDVEVRLSLGAKLRLRTTDGSSFSFVRIFQDEAMVASPDMDTVGNSKIIVPPGELTVRVHLSGSQYEKTVSVAVGEEAEVEFP